MKRLLALLLGCLMILSVIGVAQAEKTTIHFWDMIWGGEVYVEVAKALVEEFNASQDEIEVVYQSVPWADYTQAFTTAIAGGMQIDCSTGSGAMQHFFAKTGSILSLDPLIEMWEAEGTLDDFEPFALGQMQLNGVQIGIPWQIQSKVLWYNEAMLKEAGYDRPPETLSELFDYCVTIKEKGVCDTPYAFPLAMDQGALNYLGFAQSNGTGIWDDDLNVIIDSEENVKTFQFFRDMMQAGLLPEDVAALDQTLVDGMFESGKVAFAYGANVAALIERMPEAKMMNPIMGDYQAAPLQSIVHAMMAYNTTKSPEATYTFMKWWSENNLKLFSEGKFAAIPARISFRSDPVFTENPIYKQTIEELLPKSIERFWPRKELFAEAQTFFAENPVGISLQEAVLTDRPIEDILADCKATIEDMMF